MDGNTMVLLESYGARLARQGLAASTRRKYLAAVDRFLCSFDGADPASVTRQQVDDYLDRWHAAEQPAPASVRLHLSALKSFYGYLDDRGLLEGRNPVERIKAPRVRRRPNDRLRAEEAEAMLAACLSEQEKVLIWLLRWTGLRVGEALGLTVEDVDLERRVIRVRASKTDAGLRTVPVVDELGVVLLAWIERLRTRADWRPDLPLLATRGGTPWKDPFAWRLVKRVAHRAELRHRARAAPVRGYAAHASPDVRLRPDQPWRAARARVQDARARRRARHPTGLRRTRGRNRTRGDQESFGVLTRCERL
jgi:integrase